MATTNAPSTGTAAVAQELVDLCRAGRNEDAINKFYSDKIVSIESMGSESMPAETQGIDAIRSKNKWWAENMEVHSADVIGPFVGGDGFAVRYSYETTFKPTGKRSTMKEMALYKVADGKIVKEEFFYAPSA
jgi:ketosteroid isomerase-like protein